MTLAALFRFGLALPTAALFRFGLALPTMGMLMTFWRVVVALVSLTTTMRSLVALFGFSRIRYLMATAIMMP